MNGNRLAGQQPVLPNHFPFTPPPMFILSGSVFLLLVWVILSSVPISWSFLTPTMFLPICILAWYDHYLPLRLKAGWESLFCTWALSLTIAQFGVVFYKEVILYYCATLLFQQDSRTVTEQIFKKIEDATRMHANAPVPQRMMDLS